MNKIWKLLSLTIVLLLFLAFAGCKKDNIQNNENNVEENNNEDNRDNNEDNNKDNRQNIVSHESYKIMIGTSLETEVHVFTSSIEGPTIFITGGTHGDELAGWKAAEKLLTKEYYEKFIGKVIIIPYLNKLACDLQQRYPGVSNKGSYNGETYSDLNRAFPGKEDGTLTEQLAFAICEEVRKYNPKYVVDLHESRGSYTTEDTGKYKLGNELLYANGKSSLMCEDILEIFNRDYLSTDDVRWNQEGPGVEGSFNAWYGQTLKLYGFTIETSRQLSLEKRVSQQLKVLEILFEYAWNEE